jgi:hypothetical protein
MTIKQVTMYEARDGSLYRTEADAIMHNEAMFVREQLALFVEESFVHNMTREELTDLLFAGRHDLSRILGGDSYA